MSKKNSSLSLWLSLVAIIAIAVLAIVYISSPREVVAPEDGPNANVQEGDWVAGNPDAEIVFIEYGDFECPACARAYTVVNNLKAEFGDHVAFVYRHYPLTRIHPGAEPAAYASEAAGAQGKFWEMHDILYERQEDWVDSNFTETFTAYAQELELDIEQFLADYESGATEDAVDADVRNGRLASVQGTPTFFIDGRQINLRGEEQFRDTLRNLIRNQDGDEEDAEDAS